MAAAPPDCRPRARWCRRVRPRGLDASPGIRGGRAGPDVVGHGLGGDLNAIARWPSARTAQPALDTATDPVVRPDGRTGHALIGGTTRARRIGSGRRCSTSQDLDGRPVAPVVLSRDRKRRIGPCCICQLISLRDRADSPLVGARTWRSRPTVTKSISRSRRPATAGLLRSIGRAILARTIRN